MSLSSRHESSSYFSLCCFKHIFTLVSRSSSLLFALCSLTPSLQADRFIHEAIVLLFSSTVFLKLFTFFDRSLFFSIHDFHFKCFAFFPPHFLFPSSLYMTTVPFSFLSFYFSHGHSTFFTIFQVFLSLFFPPPCCCWCFSMFCTCTLWFVELPCAFSMTCVM